MKKVLFVLVFFMAVIAVNAQTSPSADSKEKPVRTMIQVADLQKTITDNVAKEFVGYTIKEATSVTENGNLTYEVVIVKDANTQTLVYDKNGVLVKNVVPVVPEKK
jgi:uncharacterized membrane protein YkoI